LRFVGRKDSMPSITLTGDKQVIFGYTKSGERIAFRAREFRKKNGRKKIILVGPLALAGKREK
jgi:hypothetical protein